MKSRSRFGIFAALLCFFLAADAVGQVTRYRKAVRIPDIPGYLTLKCDLHIHTVFSDGSVWPDVRSEEAWREGLDAIAITDHIEYLPHKEDLPPHHDRPFEIAKPHGDRLDVIVIRGSEVTRDMPPGHLNAIFLERVQPLETDQWRDSVRAARDQGAFIFWNHPGWTGQQPDGVARWYPEHTELVENGLLHGVEVVNERTYYPEAHRWCLEKKLTMLSNSDIHQPLNLDYEPRRGDHRPITLVFAKERSLASIREALFDRRTAVYSENLLIGEERFLRPIFEQSIHIQNPSLEVRGRDSALLRIENRSEIDFELLRSAPVEGLQIPERITLKGNATVLLAVRAASEELDGESAYTLPFTVTNLKTTPEEGLPASFTIRVRFLPKD